MKPSKLISVYSLNGNHTFKYIHQSLCSDPIIYIPSHLPHILSSSLLRFSLLLLAHSPPDDVISLLLALAPSLSIHAVPGLLEHESIQGISNSRPIGSQRFSSHVTVEMVLEELSTILNILEQNGLRSGMVYQVWLTQGCT